MALSKVSVKGQTTLPKEVREILHIKNGDLLQYEIDGNVIKISKLDLESTLWHKSLTSTMDEWKGSDDDDL